MNKQTQNMMDIDLALADVYKSWLDTGMDDRLSDIEREMIYVHFQLAYVTGREETMQEVIPTVNKLHELLKRAMRGLQ